MHVIQPFIAWFSQMPFPAKIPESCSMVFATRVTWNQQVFKRSY